MTLDAVAVNVELGNNKFGVDEESGRDPHPRRELRDSSGKITRPLTNDVIREDELHYEDVNQRE
jgi:hypothetical protein